jgi:sulfoquinovosidase
VRPLWFTDAALADVTHAFTLGSDVLVAPAFSPGAARTTLPLPAGRWQHVWSSRAYEGGRTVTVESPIGEPAVFVRAGSRLGGVIRRAAAGTASGRR